MRARTTIVTLVIFALLSAGSYPAFAQVGATGATLIGTVILASVPPGTYDLTAEASGFSKFTETGIVLSVGQTANADVSLKVASAEQNVVVTTETPVIETTKTEISQVVQPQQIESLPISG